jgi:hypothetical protein
MMIALYFGISVSLSVMSYCFVNSMASEYYSRIQSRNILTLMTQYDRLLRQSREAPIETSE